AIVHPDAMAHMAFPATFVIGRFGTIEEVDDEACRLLGYVREELLALHGTDLLLAEDRPRVAVSLDGMRDGTVSARTGRLVRKDGSVVGVDVTARTLPDGWMALTVQPTSEGPR
ncbi:MAG TPA: PAS domain-containing protein, partial [Candidatus Binatia bacterium]